MDRIKITNNSCKINNIRLTNLLTDRKRISNFNFVIRASTYKRIMFNHSNSSILDIINFTIRLRYTAVFPVRLYICNFCAKYKKKKKHFTIRRNKRSFKSIPRH